MNKYLIIFILLISITLGACSDKKLNIIGLPLDTSNILFESSYSNHAWGYQYSGYIFLMDGSIYSFDTNQTSVDSLENNSINDFLQEKSFDNKNLIVKNSFLLENIKVSKIDLASMIECIYYINPDKKSKIVGKAYDFGQSSIYIYDYNSNNEIEIYTDGDSSQYNTDTHAKKLVKLINKYTDQISEKKYAKQQKQTQEKYANWQKTVFDLYNSKLEVYSDLSNYELGTWKRYYDENNNQCIIQVIDKKIDTRNPNEITKFGRGYLEESDIIKLYLLNNIIAINVKGSDSGPDWSNDTLDQFYYISIDDIHNGHFDVYTNPLEYAKREVIYKLPSKEISYGEFVEKVQNNEIEDFLLN